VYPRSTKKSIKIPNAVYEALQKISKNQKKPIDEILENNPLIISQLLLRYNVNRKIYIS